MRGFKIWTALVIWLVVTLATAKEQPFTYDPTDEVDSASWAGACDQLKKDMAKRHQTTAILSRDLHLLEFMLHHPQRGKKWAPIFWVQLCKIDRLYNYWLEDENESAREMGDKVLHRCRWFMAYYERHPKNFNPKLVAHFRKWIDRYSKVDLSYLPPFEPEEGKAPLDQEAP